MDPSKVYIIFYMDNKCVMMPSIPNFSGIQQNIQSDINIKSIYLAPKNINGT